MGDVTIGSTFPFPSSVEERRFGSRVVAETFERYEIILDNCPNWPPSMSAASLSNSAEKQIA
eukprot:scaffold4901_cov105-Cylindrotheca_fusiformis.AAC.5